MYKLAHFGGLPFQPFDYSKPCHIQNYILYTYSIYIIHKMHVYKMVNKCMILRKIRSNFIPVISWVWPDIRQCWIIRHEKPDPAQALLIFFQKRVNLQESCG